MQEFSFGGYSPVASRGGARGLGDFVSQKLKQLAETVYRF